MKTFGKDFFARRVEAWVAAAFSLIIILIWLDEFVDIPHLLLNADATPMNWRESLFETLVIAPIAIGIVFYTRKMFNRMKFLEGFLPICSSCKKIRDERGDWQLLEVYIHERSAVRFSHGLCPHCAQELYPEVFAKAVVPEKNNQREA